MSVVARLDDRAFEPAAELAELIGAAAGDGAVVCFTGMARAAGKSGDSIDRLVLEHHPRLTLRSLEQIAADAAERFEISHVRVVHRCGAIAPGEPIVFAGAAARHRRPAFDAADYLMDMLKTEAVFWKREEGPAGSEWVEPTGDDYSDRGRWE